MDMHAAEMPLDTYGSARFHLLVAAHFVYAGRVGGAEQMLYNLVHGLAELDEPGLSVETTVLCADEAKLDTGFCREIGARANQNLRQTAGGGSRFLAEQRACLDPSLAAGAILFPNYYLPPVVPKRLGRTAVVLHDLQYRHFPAYFSLKKRIWLRAAQAFAVSRAERVFVISEFVRRDVLRLFGHHLDHKLVVAPNPISWSRFDAVDRERPIERPYILSVAAQYPHKNLATLIRGFAELAAHDRDTHLVLCGQDYGALRGVGGTKVGLRSLVDLLGLSSRVTITGYLDDAALGRWYRHAALFAFPSVFEGFGMPPVEALGFGLPVLTSARTALPETTLGLARTVTDAENPCAWAWYMAAMLREGDAARITLDQAARVRRTYSPATCARRYLDALKN